MHVHNIGAKAYCQLCPVSVAGNRAAGEPNEGISVGPVKFSRTAELVNARGAMVRIALRPACCRPLHYYLACVTAVDMQSCLICLAYVPVCIRNM